MGDITKRQHYVWRNYLKAWTVTKSTTGRLFAAHNKNEQWILLGKNNEGFLVGINNVAVGNYFYDTTQASEEDYYYTRLYLKKRFNELFPRYQLTANIDNLRSTERDFLEKIYISQVEKDGIPFLEKLVQGDFPFNEQSKVVTLNEKIQKDIFMSLIFQEEVPDRCLEAIEALNELERGGDKQFQFYEFLSVQYLRTKFAKNQVEKLQKLDEKIKKMNVTLAFHFFTLPIDAVTLAISLVKNNFFIKMLINKTDVPFITTDNPAINLMHNYNSEAEPKELIIYYPISPTISILCTNTIHSNCKEVILSILVYTFFSRMFDLCCLQ